MLQHSKKHWANTMSPWRLTFRIPYTISFIHCVSEGLTLKVPIEIIIFVYG